MKELTKEEFLNAFSRITVNYQQFWLKYSNDEKNRLYVQWRNMCKPYTFELIDKAMENVCKNCRYFPTFADVYTEICALKREEENRKKDVDNKALLAYNAENYNKIKQRMIEQKQKEADKLYSDCKTTEDIIKRTSALMAEANICMNFSRANGIDDYF